MFVQTASGYQVGFYFWCGICFFLKMFFLMVITEPFPDARVSYFNVPAILPPTFLFLSAYPELGHVRLPPFHHIHLDPSVANIRHVGKELVDTLLLLYEECDLILHCKNCFLCKSSHKFRFSSPSQLERQPASQLAVQRPGCLSFSTLVWLDFSGQRGNVSSLNFALYFQIDFVTQFLYSHIFHLHVTFSFIVDSCQLFQFVSGVFS